MKILVTIFCLLTFGVSVTLCAAVVKNKVCLNHAAGSPAGGEQCTNLACYEETGTGHKRVGTRYSKCSTLELQGDCNELDGWSICSYLYRYETLISCQDGSDYYSTEKTYSSNFPGCR
jgi:hypothetical protein